MGYTFQTGGLNKTKLAVYLVVLVLLVGSASLLLSGGSDEPKQKPSGFVVAKQEEPAKKVSGVNTIDDVQKQLDRLKSDINTFSSNLTSCYDNTAGLAGNLQSCKSDVALCKADFAKLSANKTVAEQTCINEKTGTQLALTAVQTESSELNKTLSALSIEYNNLKKQYNSIVSNSAANICCKAKVDNPQIKFYKTESQKIVCTEDTGTALPC